MYTQVLHKRGIALQTIKLAEEQGELVQAISKALSWMHSHGRTFAVSDLPMSFKDNIAEEIVDCRHLMEQIEIYFGLDRATMNYHEDIQLGKLERYINESNMGQ